MAITRRQFVTRLGALATAMGMGQADLAKISQAFAHGSVWTGPWTNKPKVIWVHGAECTGCSTSLLGLFEDVTGEAIVGSGITTLTALDLAVGGTGDGAAVLTDSDGNHPNGHRTIATTGVMDYDGDANSDTPYIANIADVLIDFIDLQYHETVMGMGGDLAYQWLNDNANNGSTDPFVLVVEGALQHEDNGGYWDKTGAASWCSIGMDGNTGDELDMPNTVQALAEQTTCAAVIAIGQCATFGGYPGCVSPVLGESQTGAQGTYDFLLEHSTAAAANKVINVPGCPTNPWWFILTVVAWLVDFTAGGVGPLGILTDGAINASAVDSTRRLKAVYGVPLHGPACTRYQSFLDGNFASVPGGDGCLQLIGCKGPAVNSLCTAHGWNGQQPENNAAWDQGVAAVQGKKGGNCVAAGPPCMGCTEKGYPDAFVPFVVR
jgi:hydrogenase small subunit